MDQTVFIQQGGKNQHEHICEALELFAGDVMPEFKEHEAERLRKKDEELAPYIEAAFKRKAYMRELADEDIPAYPAYGYNVDRAGHRQHARRPAPACGANAQVPGAAGDGGVSGEC
ncbi:MAG: hypothetical protein U5Q44_06965 [Dehalococcoidia bacterium]|nr:hypothetical protein [Dehalococcoidia bacterium]